MDATQYQGLFYLSSGTAAFLGLVFGFRLLAEKSAPKSVGSDKTKWRGLEALEIIERIQECKDVVTLRLRRKERKPLPRFRPGQFLTIQIGGDEKLTRSYSICSSALNEETLQISTKRLQGGIGSGWVHARKPGDEILAFPPTGHFTDADLTSEPRVFVAGGIGITPVLSMIQTNLDTGRMCEMSLFYGMRGLEDLAFHDLLLALSRRHPHFKYFPYLSGDGEGWAFERGYITFAALQTKGVLASGAHFFLCGPSVMTDSLLEQLSTNGVPEERLHFEKFASPATLDMSRIEKRKSKVAVDGAEYEYDGNQTLLEFLEASGVDMPYACRVGVCGSCKCVANGKTMVLTDSGLTQAERKAGYVLTCVTLPDDANIRLSR